MPVLANPAARRAAHASLDGSLSTDLRIAVNRLSRRLRSQKTDTSVSDAQLSALAHLHRHGPMSLTALSDAEGVTPPSMTKTVTALLTRDLIRKTEDGVDKRRILLTVTPVGSTLVVETRRKWDDWLAPRIAGLTPAEQHTLADATDILRRLAQQ